jgi:lipid-A-disaccharide synthase
MYAARLATALKQRLDVAIFGMGGSQMRAAGVEIITDYSEVSVVGITEVLKRLPSLFRAMKRLVDEAERRKPPLAILTDFPGFHLRLARKLRPRGIRNVYYICPQFWAWRPWRVNLVRRRFAQALCIFHFEEKFYADACVPVKFIGHPLVGNVKATLTRELFCRKYGLEQGNPLLTGKPVGGDRPPCSGPGGSASRVGTDLAGQFWRRGCRGARAGRGEIEETVSSTVASQIH